MVIRSLEKPDYTAPCAITDGWVGGCPKALNLHGRVRQVHFRYGSGSAGALVLLERCPVGEGVGMVPEVRAKVRFPLPVLLIGVAILIGVACASPGQGQFPTATPSTAIVGTEQGATVSPSGMLCQSADVTLAPVDRIAEPSGQHSLALALTNTSTRSCSLFGYPSVRLLDAGGHELPFTYRQSGDQVVTSRPPLRVTLAPGGVAYVTINKYRCDLGEKGTAAMVALMLPGDTSTLTMTIPPSLDLGYCGPGDPGSTVSVSPFGASLQDTLAH